MESGQPKTRNDEKHEAVIKALKDSSWVKESNRAIAGHLGVSHTYVANVRRDLKEGGKIRMSVREFLRQARRMVGLPAGFIRRGMSSKTSVLATEQEILDRLARLLHRVRYGDKTKLKEGTLPAPIRSRRSRRPRRLTARRHRAASKK
jgi:ribosomal protein L10